MVWGLEGMGFRVRFEGLRVWGIGFGVCLCFEGFRVWAGFRVCFCSFLGEFRL